MVKQKRQLNMELMRIFSMMMVLLCHTLFLSNGSPNSNWVMRSPLGTFVFIYMQSLSMIGVNCFVLISAYFGMKLTLKGFIRLIFIVLFYHLTIYGVIISLGLEPFSLKQLIKLLNPLGMEWFVSAYIGLMIFSPILNAFIEKASRKSFKTVLIVYLCFQCTFGFLLPNPMGFNFVRGHSTLAFIGLYLLGRYFRIYKEAEWISKYKSKGIFIYFVLMLIPSSIYYVASLYISNSTIFPIMKDILTNTTSPFNILGSFAILIYFSSLKVNRYYSPIMFITSSIFSVYIIHVNSFIFPYYREASHQIIESLWPLIWIPVIILYVCVVLIACILIDKIRIFIYDRLQPLLPT